jgi:hypothetical protein
MWDTFACATAKNLTHFMISIAVLENVPADAELQKRATFSTLIMGLAGSGNQTRATCIASSGTDRSAIHYAFPNTVARVWFFSRNLSTILNRQKCRASEP